VSSTGAIGPYVETIFGVVAAVDGLGLEVVWSCDGVTLGEVGLGGKQGGEERENIEEGGELHNGRTEYIMLEVCLRGEGDVFGASCVLRMLAVVVEVVWDAVIPRR
jgi:hypothetical protein